MKFTSAPMQSTAGTCLRGRITATYAKLVEVFGKPTLFSGGKIDAEWVILFESGTIATIHNYKDGRNYYGAKGTPTEEITEWSVGGHDNQRDEHGALAHVYAALASHERKLAEATAA